MHASPEPFAIPPGAPLTHVPGVVWPAIQTGDKAALLGLVFQLDQTQWWSPERLRAHQFAQLALLVRHAAETVPYYRELFARIGFDPRAPIDETAWERLPILSRADLQNAGHALDALKLPMGQAIGGETLSSGSTGSPVRAVKTTIQTLMWNANIIRDHLWHRRDLSLRHASIRNPDHHRGTDYPDGASHSQWGASAAPFLTGPSFVLALSTTVDRQAEWLTRIAPNYLTSYPSNLEALAHYCLDHDIHLPSLRQLRTLSEVMRPEVREVCRRAFGVEIADMYSAEETGYMALQAPETGEMLVPAESIHLEIVDDQGRACPPGEVGRVVVTPLHAFAMPLIRYAIGDLAEAGGKAACGRGLPVINRILGRERHMVRLPDGRRFYPTYFGLLKGFPEVRQFQIVRTEETVLELRLVATEQLSAERAQALTARIVERFQFPFEVRFIYRDTIERERSGKFLDFKTLVG